LTSAAHLLGFLAIVKVQVPVSLINEMGKGTYVQK
jgi:hypothetical protein